MILTNYKIGDDAFFSQIEDYMLEYINEYKQSSVVYLMKEILLRFI